MLAAQAIASVLDGKPDHKIPNLISP